MQSHISPSPDETVIVDEEAEEAARAEVEQDAEAFGCSLSNARVSPLGDLKIVRMDLYHLERREIAGLAMSIEQSGRIYLGIYVP